MVIIDDKKFDQVKKSAEEEYKKISRVYCPYLKEDVHFNKDGFEHLLSKSWNRGRSRIEQYTRLRLLPLVSKILEKSHTLQEYDEREMSVRQKINSEWRINKKIVRYYIFTAIINNARLKIIIKEIAGGVKFFYSLYPAWRVVKKTEGGQRKVFYTGNLEGD